jgi:large subunit ribosomal protein L17
MYKHIHTTLAKAKALRPFIEPLITKAKDDSTHSRRIVFSSLHNKEAVNELFREVATKVADRPGGYTRVIKLGMRQGDSAEMAMIELVDYNENLLTEQKSEKKSGRRTRRAGKKATDEPKQEKVEAPAEEKAPEAEQVSQNEENSKEEPEQEAAAQAETEAKAKEEPAEEKKTEKKQEQEPEDEKKSEEQSDQKKKDDK